MWRERHENKGFQFPIVKNQFEVEPAQSYGFDCKRKFSSETDIDIFDFHLSNVDEYNDIRHVTDKVLRRGLVKVYIDRLSRGEEWFQTCLLKV